jgi:hypothetical protein
MPHGPRGKRKKSHRGAKLIVKYRILATMYGPAARASHARQELHDQILATLSRCERFKKAGRDTYWADKIAASVRYQIVEQAKVERVFIRDMRVVYRNPPNTWKWWSHIVNGKEDVTLGTLAPYVSEEDTW